MILNFNGLTYLITSLFGTYIIYKFMNVFFYRSKVNKKIELLSYLLYFMITTFIYQMFNIPILNLISGIILLLMLTFNYQSSMKNRIISTFFMYLIFVSIESAIVLLSGHLYNSIFIISPIYSSIIGMITIKIVSYIVVLLIENYRDMKRGIDIQNLYWVSIFLIPLGSLYIIIELLKIPNSNIYGAVGSIAILFAINIATFYLYEIITKQYEYKVEKTILKEQNKSYKKQLEIMSNANKSLKALRHDLGNHLSVIAGYMTIDENHRAVNYIDKINEEIYRVKEFSKSGNVDIDSIVNYKLYEAREKDIGASIEIKVPSDLKISSLDITIILGNLLDNAIEAISKLEDNKTLSLKMEYKKGILFIYIKNTFNGNVIHKGDKIISSKEDKDSHGIGLNNIENVVKKYNGIMKIDYTDSEFMVDVMMYLD